MTTIEFIIKTVLLILTSIFIVLSYNRFLNKRLGIKNVNKKTQAHPSFKRNADLTLDKVHDSKMNNKVFELENLINKMIIDFEKENELEKIKVFSHFPQSPFERVQPKCYLVRIIR